MFENSVKSVPDFYDPINRNRCMTSHVFTYGSLMFTPVWESVVQGRYRSVAALLDQHARFALVDDTYPGTVAAVGSSVAGVLYLDVSRADLACVDHFEGNEYRRTLVQVQLDDASLLPAQTYLFEAVARLSDRSWNPDTFPMAGFLDTYCRDKLG